MARYAAVSAPDIDRIVAAHRRLDDHVRRTPLLESPFLDRIAGCRVLIKAECLQHTGSFKYRGARAALTALTDAQRRAGVLAYSSGNHAQGVARAAAELGALAVILMPSDAPRLKIANTRALGAEVRLYDRQSEDRDDLGNALAVERGLTLIRPFDDAEVIAGQASVGLELAAQAEAAGLRRADVLTCCGGGGLSAGIALALADRAPGLRVRTVEPEGFDDTARSLEAGQRLSNAGPERGFCDAILTPRPGALTFPVLSRLAGPGLVVTDDEVRRAMALAFRHLKIVVEPGGAVALAAALFHKNLPRGADPSRGGAVIAVATGGNVDAETFSGALAALDQPETAARSSAG